MPINLLSMKALLKEVEKLNPTELEAFVDEVLSMKARHHVPSLDQKETELLLAVNQKLPTALQSRFEFLTKKRREGSLTEQEHAELLGLSDQIEKRDLERLKLLSELAQLRGISLRALTVQLGMKPIANA